MCKSKRIGKREIVESMSHDLSLPKAAAERYFNAAFSAIKEALKVADSVNIPELGTFKVKQSPAREGRNPRTGERINIPSRPKVSFRLAAGMKNELDERR